MNCLMYPVASAFGRRFRRTDSGAALVIALACIVILTGLVLAVLTHSMLETQVSDASASQTEASLFARGAADSVIGELKQEITAGSVSTYPPTGSDMRDPNCFFLPATNQAMVPYRMDAGAPANVIKRSAYNVPFYAGTYYNTTTWPAPNWAANLSTTNTGVTGRAISMARWNKPLLMPLSPTATDLTPTNTFIPPDWIYMTRTGGPATTWNASLVPNTSNNTNSVVGRYAYVVYDEGGLLDANAAGYPSWVNSSMVRHKISEACADLTQIGLTTADIDTLVTWRNPINATNSPASAYTNYVYTAATNAFLTPASGERIFTSRQQLIAFLTQNVANGDSTAVARMQAALPYLTHFSRELNAPSWYPQTNIAVSGFLSYPYLSNSTNNPPTATTTNIFSPLARAGSSYTDVSNLTVQKNQAVAFGRFPLSRLSWLGTAGLTNGATATQVVQSFGLVWDGPNYAWKYVGPTISGPVLSSVSTLAQVTGRQPNFFELLKAGILAGAVNVVPSPQFSSFPNFGAIDSRYYQNDQQIMQIGLSMIDQASSAVLPTRIEFGSNTTGDWNGALYGNKNLPYIYKMVFSPYRPSSMPPDVNANGTYNNQWFSAWEEPVFWSPYQTVNTNNATALQIRIRADGTNNGTAGQMGAQTVAQGAGSSLGANLNLSCQPEITCGPAGSSTGAGGVNGSSIELDSTSASTFSSLTGTPVLLSSLLTNGITPVFNDLRAVSPPLWPTQANADVYTESGCTYAGFWLGNVLARDPPDLFQPTYQFNTTTPVPYSQALFYSGIKSYRANYLFVLEANYGTTASPNFLEVQRMQNQYTSGAAVEEYDNFTVLQRRLNFFTFNDPRTGRFSWDIIQPSDYNPSAPPPAAPLTAIDAQSPTWTTFMASTNNAFTGLIKRVVVTNPNVIVITPSGAAGVNPAAVDTFRWADNTATSGTATTPIYQDSDGVQRPADGWWSSSAANTLPMREDMLQYRPVLLNRSFYSVGELGYVFRDMPWRSLNFSSATSPDAGLLDFFCVTDGYAGSTTAPVVAGVLNLNTPHPEVLAAMLNGAARAQLYPAFDVNSTDATSIGNTITTLTGTLPLINKSEIATRLTPADPTVLTTATTEPGIDTNIKERREVIARALANAGQVRTWNLMIDVIAQTGHLPPTATGFNNFIVTAEQRYWAHVAIDRYTGQVISVQLEPVSE